MLLKNPSRRIEAGSVVDRLNEHLVQDDGVPRVLSTRRLVFQPEHEDSVIEDDGRVRNSFRRQKTLIEGAVATPWQDEEGQSISLLSSNSERNSEV